MSHIRLLLLLRQLLLITSESIFARSGIYRSIYTFTRAEVELTLLMFDIYPWLTCLISLHVTGEYAQRMVSSVRDK